MSGGVAASSASRRSATVDRALRGLRLLIRLPAHGPRRRGGRRDPGCLPGASPARPQTAEKDSVGRLVVSRHGHHLPQTRRKAKAPEPLALVEAPASERARRRGGGALVDV